MNTSRCAISAAKSSIARIGSAAERAAPRRQHDSTTKQWLVSGRLALHACAPYSGITWERYWREQKAGQFSGLFSGVAKELESEAAKIVELLEKPKLEEEERHRKWEIERREIEKREAERRRAEQELGRQKDVVETIANWRLACDLRGYIAGVTELLRDSGMRVTSGGDAEEELAWMVVRSNVAELRCIIVRSAKMGANKDRFDKAFKEIVVPTLRALGFRGSHPTFRRDDGKIVGLVNVQASSGGDGCYVNLAVHHRALKEAHTNWEKLREYQCAFRARLDNVAGQGFFSYGTSDENAALQALGLSEMLKTEGKMWFDQLSSPDALARTLKSLANKGVEVFVPFGPPAWAETWARLAKALGDNSSEHAFLAQARSDEEARVKKREEEATARAATTFEMTHEEYRAARKAGTIPLGATIQFVTAPSRKSPTTTRTVRAKPKVQPKKGTKKTGTKRSRGARAKAVSRRP